METQTFSREEVLALLYAQRIICISKFAHHTDLEDEDIYNIPFPSEFRDEPSVIIKENL